MCRQGATPHPSVLGGSPTTPYGGGPTHLRCMGSTARPLGRGRSPRTEAEDAVRGLRSRPRTPRTQSEDMPRASEDAVRGAGGPRLSSHVSSSSRGLQCLMEARGAVHMPPLAEGVFADCAHGGAGLDASPEASLEGGAASPPPSNHKAVNTGLNI